MARDLGGSMTLTLPEELMLFALRDDRGTVHSAAFLALDPALRGAILAELKLQGHIQVRQSGELRRVQGTPPKNPLVLDGYHALLGAPAPSTAERWFAILGEQLVGLRSRVVAVLERRGILVAAPKQERDFAWMSDQKLEHAAQQRLLAALDAHDSLPPRDGILIALVVACHLDGVVFGPRAQEARTRAAWVSERDAVVRAVSSLVAEIEGAW
jgi:hypothetical protein